ncbi:unnamed protein product [Larinioides sclopetarius]
MVETAIKALAEPKGSSLKAINKYIDSNYSVDTKKLATFIKKYLKAAVEKGVLIQPKGKGASGSFKFSKQKPEPKLKVPKAKSLKMQTSTPNKLSKPKKADTKSPNKSPVKKVKLTDKVVSADATFSKTKTKKTQKPKLSLPTKPRKSITSATAKVKKAKKLMAKKANNAKVSSSPGGKSENITSPKSVKTKGTAKSTKTKKSPKPEKATLIPKKVAAKKAAAKDGQK